MPHQLVSQRAADSLEEQRVIGVLENGTVSLLLDVLEVLTRGAVGWIFLAHVAKPAGKLGQTLAIGALAKPANLQMLGLQENRAREQGYDWFSVKHGSLGKKKRAHSSSR